MSILYFADGETQVWESKWAVLGLVMALKTGPRVHFHQASSMIDLGFSVPMSLDVTAWVLYASDCHSTWVNGHTVWWLLQGRKSCLICMFLGPNEVLALLVFTRLLEGEPINEWWVRSKWMNVSSIESLQLVVIKYLIYRKMFSEKHPF